jgi:hypothetical protein
MPSASSHRIRSLTSALVGLWLGVSGCGASAYEAARRAWTREEQVYDQFQAKAFAVATLKLEPFRRAWVDEYARLFDLNREQREALLEAELEEDRVQLVALVAFYTPQPSWNDLNPARAIWEVRLENGRGETSAPFSVRRLDKRNPTWNALLPWLDAYHTLYELRFERQLPDGRPLARGGEPLDLIIAGAPAQLRMRWTIP